VLARLARVTGEMTLEETARGVTRAFSEPVSRSAVSHTFMLCALDFLVGPTFELVIAGRRGADDVRGMRRALDAEYLPGGVALFRPDDDPSRVVRLAPYTREQVSRGGRATAYVCRNFACERPTTSPEEMMRLVRAAAGPPRSTGQ
jgi:hypothetical protein